MERIAIFGALRWECRPPLRRLRQARRERLGDVAVWRGATARGEVWVIQTGMGQARAAAAAARIAASGPFDLFLSTGCAGALAPELEPGDLAIASEIVAGAATDPFPADPAASAHAQRSAARAGVRWALGRVLSATAVLPSAAAKQQAATDADAIAVEMEGAAIAAAAERAGIPFASVRAILDRADTELDAAAPFVDPATGAVRPLALARHLAAHPGKVAELLALQRMMAAARESLERFFAAFLAEEQSEKFKAKS